MSLKKSTSDSSCRTREISSHHIMKVIHKQNKHKNNFRTNEPGWIESFFPSIFYNTGKTTIHTFNSLKKDKAKKKFFLMNNIWKTKNVTNSESSTTCSQPLCRKESTSTSHLHGDSSIKHRRVNAAEVVTYRTRSQADHHVVVGKEVQLLPEGNNTEKYLQFSSFQKAEREKN